MTRPYTLPSRTALACFEAAARHNSFKIAAQDLNVAPAAISHQVEALEAELAQGLFRLQHRDVELAEAGAYLFVALQRGFDGTSGAVREIRGRPAEKDAIVQATTAVSAFWLTPQISTFGSRHSDIVISQIVGDVEPIGDRVDLIIHYDPIPEDGGDYRILFRDRIVAVGAPDYARTYRIRGLSDVTAAPLFHVSSEQPEWTNWKEWTAEVGQTVPSGRHFTVNDFMIALQLADGVGAALGWDSLIVTLLEREGLVRPAPEELAAPRAF